MKYPRILTREVMWWAPHYDDPQQSGTLPPDTVVSILSDVYEQWEGQPAGQGHIYWLLEWTEGDREERGWIRTYAHRDENSFSKPPPELATQAPTVVGTCGCPIEYHDVICPVHPGGKRR